jgi:proline iminopeptidase
MGGTVPVSGTELFYESIGVGDPVVVLGGTALGHSYLRPAMDRLADSFRLIYYDQRGSGSSPLGDAERLRFDIAIADLAALLDGLGLEKAHPGSQSWW